MRRLSETYIVFLDIDGVLNHAGCKCEKDFLQESIDVLNYLYDKYEIEIVLSSSWRTAYTMKYMNFLFSKNGIKADIIDKTPEYIGEYDKQAVENSEGLTLDQLCEAAIPPDAGRNREIIHWVRRHDVKKFVILDDFFFTNDICKKHLVQTSWHDEINGGLRKEHIPLIEKIFEIED